MAAICRASRNSTTFTLHFMLCSFRWGGPSRPAPDYAALPFTGFAGVFGAAPTRLPAAPSLASRRLHWHLKQSFLPSYLSLEFSMILVTDLGFRGCVRRRPHAVAGGPQLGVPALALALEAELLALVLELGVLDDPGHREQLQHAVALDVDLDARDLLTAVLTELLRLGPLGELRTGVGELPVGVDGMPDLGQLVEVPAGAEGHAGALERLRMRNRSRVLVVKPALSHVGVDANTGDDHAHGGEDLGHVHVLGFLAVLADLLGDRPADVEMGHRWPAAGAPNFIEPVDVS